MNQNILEKAIHNFAERFGYLPEWEEYDRNEKNDIECRITFRVNGKKKIIRNAEIRKEIRKHHVPHLQKLKERFGPVILVAERLYPNIKAMLNDAGIDWMDTAGNMRINEGDTLIWIDHHTSTPVQIKKNRAFTKTGLKVVFLFLQDEAWLNKTYREIAEAAGVALGNIKLVLDGLKEHGFILPKNKKMLQLKNREKLMDQWITGFVDELKPRIVRGRYTFINRKAEQNWKKLNLETEAVWGGEPAADLLTNDLKPLEFILYTILPRADLMKKLKIVPDNNGNIEIREPYWVMHDHNTNTAPALVVYTDLIETGDPRNVNAAKKLYEKAD